MDGISHPGQNPAYRPSVRMFHFFDLQNCNRVHHINSARGVSLGGPMTTQHPHRQERVAIESDVLDHLGFCAPNFLVTLVETVRDCVKLLTPEGRIRYVNDNAAEMLGSSSDQLRDTVWSSHWPPEARVILEDAVDRATAGEPTYCEVLRDTSEGMRPWAINVFPIGPRDGSIDSLLVVTHELPANANERPDAS